MVGYIGEPSSPPYHCTMNGVDELDVSFYFIMTVFSLKEWRIYFYSHKSVSIVLILKLLRN